MLYIMPFEHFILALALGTILGLGWHFYKRKKSTKMGQPLYEYEAGFIKNLKSSTGKDFREWLTTIGASGLTEKKAVRDWLQKEHKLDYLPAHKLSFLFAENRELHDPKVWFSSGGREGEIGYESKEGSFKIYWEMGGGDVLAILSVPPEEHWEAQTGIPLAKRAEVLDFIGRETVRQQTASGRGTFEIQDGFILIRS